MIGQMWVTRSQCQLLLIITNWITVATLSSRHPLRSQTPPTIFTLATAKTTKTNKIRKISTPILAKMLLSLLVEYQIIKQTTFKMMSMTNKRSMISLMMILNNKFWRKLSVTQGNSLLTTKQHLSVVVCRVNSLKQNKINWVHSQIPWVLRRILLQLQITCTHPCLI